VTLFAVGLAIGIVLSVEVLAVTLRFTRRWWQP
jgi:hypothetical protein